MSYINNQKGKIKRKYKCLLSFFKLVLILLKLVSVDFVTIKNIRYLDNFETEIYLVIQGQGNKRILNNTFTPKPHKVLVNGQNENTNLQLYYCACFVAPV